jgi:hypothetical protein
MGPEEFAKEVKLRMFYMAHDPDKVRLIRWMVRKLTWDHINSHLMDKYNCSADVVSHAQCLNQVKTVVDTARVQTGGPPLNFVPRLVYNSPPRMLIESKRVEIKKEEKKEEKASTGWIFVASFCCCLFFILLVLLILALTGQFGHHNVFSLVGDHDHDHHSYTATADAEVTGFGSSSQDGGCTGLSPNVDLDSKVSGASTTALLQLTPCENMAAGSKVTFTFPPSFSLMHSSVDKAAALGIDPSFSYEIGANGRSITFTTPTAVAAGTRVKVPVLAVDNPRNLGGTGDYGVVVTDSAGLVRSTGTSSSHSPYLCKLVQTRNPSGVIC